MELVWFPDRLPRWPRGGEAEAGGGWVGLGSGRGPGCWPVRGLEEEDLASVAQHGTTELVLSPARDGMGFTPGPVVTRRGRKVA